MAETKAKAEKTEAEPKKAKKAELAYAGEPDPGWESTDLGDAAATGEHAYAGEAAPGGPADLGDAAATGDLAYAGNPSDA